jgi:hypothetical protein
MKAIGIILGTVGASCFALSMAFANPGMLPAHPGYPAKGNPRQLANQQPMIRDKQTLLVVPLSRHLRKLGLRLP